MSRRTAHKLAQDALVHVVDTGQLWISAIRWRALAWVVGITFATVATVVMTGAWIPVVGAAVVAAAVSINRVASKLTSTVCYGCGRDLADQPKNAIGLLCPACGAIHQPRLDGGCLPADEYADAHGGGEDDDRQA